MIYKYISSIYLYTYKTLVVLLDCLVEAVRRFDNSRVQSTCYESWSNYSSTSDSTFKVKFLSASNSIFEVKMTIFSLGALREKLSYFDLKSWV